MAILADLIQNNVAVSNQTLTIIESICQIFSKSKNRAQTD